MDRWWKSLGITLLIAFGSMAIAVIIHHAPTVYPTADTKSSFLKSYSPADVIARFKASNGSQQLQSGGSEAGRSFATHQREIRNLFVMRSADEGRLMAALREDLTSKLQFQAGKIVEQAGDPSSGYQFDYIAGKEIGKVSLKPLEVLDPASITRPAARLATGNVAVSVSVVIEEKWIPHS
jgi:hypothetical protein